MKKIYIFLDFDAKIRIFSSNLRQKLYDFSMNVLKNIPIEKFGSSLQFFRFKKIPEYFSELPYNFFIK